MPISKIKTSSITGDAASINLNIDAGTLFLDVANNRVGIANTAPDLPLDVRGTVGSNGDALRTMVLVSTNTATAGYGGGIAFGGFFNGTTNRTNDFAGIQGFKENGTEGDYAGALRFTTRINGGSPTERIRVTSIGSVGIGTVSPTRRLHVQTSGTGAVATFQSDAGPNLAFVGTEASGRTYFIGEGLVTAGNFSIYDNNATAERLVVASSGSVGIGTSSPVSGRRLTVATTGTDSAIRIDAPTGYQSYLELTENGSLTSGNYWQIGKIATTNALQFWNGTERMRISSAGKVGIGNTDPTAPLHVNGIVSDSLTASSSNFKLASGGGDGIAMGSFQAAPFGSWIQSGYLANGYNPPFNGGYPLILNPSGGGVVIGGDTSLQYSARLYVNGAVACRHGGVDSSPLPSWTAGYTSNYTERNIISTSVSSNGGNSGFYFYVSDGAGSANTTLSLRVNRGSCQVIGSLSKGSGSFKIDHPLPEKENTHHLVHSFIEGPQADLIYRGKVVLVNGRADVNVDIASGMTDGTFVVLCREVQCFTTNETGWTAVRGKVTGNMLTIEAQDNTCTDEISWMVIGERQDKHMIDTGWTDENGKVIVEPEKPAINAPMSAIIPEPEEFNLDSESTSTDGE